ncbi:MAG: F0F1 ATP synthase subunit epsilon [Bacteroidales bacterium]|jgi:F-type H+-transporting ATPase subunit epsilon|nr:F0F1 ATP synthase subunit epsilon [Bacteroidales bacterium]MBO7378184.1 F0F1 ATP synthase subunit epsilon [Bacteroidales bacterium]MBP5213079.1 F0F1 ATP synthase subunit epsilon [Bacteroidales bacterium]MBP5764072.1 F0F1 ATP synthase subunit epsilon [Bacteroidales bacterium]
MKLTIYSPEKTVFDGEVSLVEVPGTKGRFEILPNHDAIISTLQPGVIRYISEGKETRQPVTSGYVEVHKNIISACVQL